MEELRRFIEINDTTELQKLIKRKALNHDDLVLIFKSLDINHTVFPEIVKLREAAHTK